MNRYDLQKIIHVVNYINHSSGANIHYIKGSKTNFLTFYKRELFNDLVAIGTYEDTPEDINEFEDYRMSQWDALNLAIHHELQKEADRDIDKSDIGQAISKLTKPNT